MHLRTKLLRPAVRIRAARLGGAWEGLVGTLVAWERTRRWKGTWRMLVGR